jgi:coenzyme F420-reducing hydrogenase delta subunit
VGYVKKLLDEIGLGGARLEMFNMSPAQCANMNEMVGTLAAKVKELGPSPARPGASPVARQGGRS